MNTDADTLDVSDLAEQSILSICELEVSTSNMYKLHIARTHTVKP